MNVPISRILVPVDFSAHSDLALRYAETLADCFGAAVELLHVVEDPIASGAWSAELYVPDVTDFRKELVEDAQRRLEQCRAGMPERPHVRTAATVRLGHPSQTITEYAKVGQVNLIVMGTHGRGGLAHLVMGSVAERVIRHAPCPVLTVRDTAGHPQADVAHAGHAVALGSTPRHAGSSRE